MSDLEQMIIVWVSVSMSWEITYTKLWSGTSQDYDVSEEFKD